jgi:RHS repeat-associated protein
MSANALSQTVFSIGYDFHIGNGTSGVDNGNVYGITNYKDQNRNQTFTYDALNRLISAQNAGTNCAATVIGGKSEYWGNSYGYDAWGNLLQKNVTKCGAEGLTVTADGHNWIHASGTDYQYDAAGNMTFNATAPTQTYTYDQENRLTGAAGYTYTYDSDGNRVRKSNASTGTLYWYMMPGIVGESDLSGNLTDEYIFFDGERVARKSTNGVFYYFSDHLKTASVITDAAGNIASESDFYPWGGELQFLANDSNHYKYAGHERDNETSLDYYGARYYSNPLARFLTPDWNANPVSIPYADLSNPQSFNQYAYVRNNPISYSDPDGHDGGTAAAVMELFAGGTEGAEVSAGSWAVGSVALPGLLGGGLGYGAINSTAQNYNTVANAQMAEVAASNKLIMAQQAALSQDAQAGALIKSGKDANKEATATVEAAMAGIAAGKYKDAADVQAHVDKLKEGMKDVARATEALKNAVGQKARDAAKEALKKATKEVKGHEKDLQQKKKVKTQKGE